MTEEKNAFFRYIEILRLLPKGSPGISTPKLLEKLLDKGYKVDIRTLQRDLDKLSGSYLFPFTSTENTKPLKWFWPANTPRLDLPLMSVEEALTFKLVEKFLDSLLPKAIKSSIEPYLQLADKVLKASPLAGWMDKISIIPSGLSLLPAEINQDILTLIHEALLKNRCFKASYRGRSNEDKFYELNPLGLVFRNNVIYLVATVDNYSDIRQFALHRFQSAELSQREIAIHTEFDLKEYIAQGEFDYPTISNSQEIELKLKINRFMSKYLTETPLSKDQTLTELGDDKFILIARVKESEQLKWWIRSFSTGIEVLEPLALRAEFAKAAQDLSNIYSD